MVNAQEMEGFLFLVCCQALLITYIQNPLCSLVIHLHLFQNSLALELNSYPGLPSVILPHQGL